jgi:hypothetical protein
VFLSIVEVDKVPLCLVAGSSCPVFIDGTKTNGWLSSILTPELPIPSPSCEGTWQQTARLDSPLGILLRVDTPSQPKCGLTEILLYATRSKTTGATHVGDQLSASQPTLAAGFQLHALPLDSGILNHPRLSEPTPPPSPPTHTVDEDGIFLPPLAPLDEVINEPPVRKRKSAADAFDEANERRKKAKGKGGHGVSAAAATKVDSQVPSLHRRSVSNSQPVPSNRQPLSRSPSIASSRPPTAVATAQHRSALSRVQSIAGDPDDDEMESKNKKFISRIVMAGMRLYGLSQSKRRQSDIEPSQNLERDNEDEEYKMVYHQAYKGACFAFRGLLQTQDLQPLSEAIRDVVDRLLAIFCTDPLAEGLSGTQSKLTPGGRKAFGSE